MILGGPLPSLKSWKLSNGWPAAVTSSMLMFSFPAAISFWASLIETRVKVAS